MRKTVPAVLIAVLTVIMLSGCNVKVTTADDPKAVDLTIDRLSSDENGTGLQDEIEEEEESRNLIMIRGKRFE